MSPGFARVWAALVFLLSPIIVIVARLTWGTGIPQSLPTHFNGHGQADGATNAGVFFWVCLVICTVLALGGATLSMSRNTPRALDYAGLRALGPVAIIAFLSWLFAVGYARLLYAAYGSQSPEAVHLPARAAIVIVGAPVVAAIVVSVAIAVFGPGDRGE